jgi:uncharacterized protein (DUF433 family)
MTPPRWRAGWVLCGCAARIYMRQGVAAGRRLLVARRRALLAETPHFTLRDLDVCRIMQFWSIAVQPLDRITVDPQRMNGQPTIRGMRLTVKRVVQMLGVLCSVDKLLEQYPELEVQDVMQALQYAAAAIEDETLALSAA